MGKKYRVGCKGLDEFGKPEGHSCASWYNAKLIGKAKVLRKININTLN